MWIYPAIKFKVSQPSRHRSIESSSPTSLQKVCTRKTLFNLNFWISKIIAIQLYLSLIPYLHRKQHISTRAHDENIREQIPIVVFLFWDSSVSVFLFPFDSKFSIWLAGLLPWLLYDRRSNLSETVLLVHPDEFSVDLSPADALKSYRKFYVLAHNRLHIYN